MGSTPKKTRMYGVWIESSFGVCRMLKSPRSVIQGALSITRIVRQFSSSKLWIALDKKADVLYISLKRPQKASKTVEMDDEGILLRYRDKELVGITVLDASKR